MNPTFSGILALAIFSFGTLFFALSELPPFQLSAMMFFSGALSVAIYAKYMGFSFDDYKTISVPEFFIALLGIGFYQVLIIIAFQISPAFEINMLNYLWPIFLVLFVKLRTKSSFRHCEWIGMVMGFIGMICIFLPQNGTIFSHIGYGHVFAVLGAVLWAFYSAVASKRKKSIILMCLVMFLTACISLICHILFEENVWNLSVYGWMPIIILCVTRFCFALWDFGMRDGDQVLLGSISYFLPLLSSLYFIAAGFSPGRWEVVAGGTLIIAGCFIVNFNCIKLSRGSNDATP